MNPRHSSQQMRRPGRGFSLIELLTVIAIISLLASVITPALAPMLQGRSAASAVDIVSSTAAVARQTAMSKGKPVALVISRQPGTGVTDVQGILLMSFTSSHWTPFGNWTRLPANIRAGVYTRDGTASFYPGDGGGAISGNLPVKFNGTDPTYDYVVFQPDGSVDAPATGPALTFSRLNRPTTSADYFLVLQSDSGRSKFIEN